LFLNFSSTRQVSEADELHEQLPPLPTSSNHLFADAFSAEREELLSELRERQAVIEQLQLQISKQELEIKQLKDRNLDLLKNLRI
jgi:hypothetical protein